MGAEKERGRGNTFRILVFPPIFLFPLSLFPLLSLHGKEDKKMGCSNQCPAPHNLYRRKKVHEIV
jgi:hypothetical protein